MTPSTLLAQTLEQSAPTQSLRDTDILGTYESMHEIVRRYAEIKMRHLELGRRRGVLNSLQRALAGEGQLLDPSVPGEMGFPGRGIGPSRLQEPLQMFQGYDESRRKL